MSQRRVNPWLEVPAGEYDGHMAEVGQSAILEYLLERSVTRWPFNKGFCLLGAATGNGFDRIPVQKNERLVAVDLNLTYLSLLKKRHGDRFPHLETVCKDVMRCQFPNAAFDHIHAALFFEYVDPAETLRHIRPWLTDGGVLSVVLQLPAAKLVSNPNAAPSGGGQISPSSHPGVNVLHPLLKLVPPEEFLDHARAAGFTLLHDETVPVPHGKAFRWLGLSR